MAKKMILIDPRLLESMNQKQQYVPPDSLTASLRELDNQMQQVLDRETLSPRDKARQYQQILQRYTNRLDDYRHKPLGLVDMNPPPTPPAPIQPFEQPQVSSPSTPVVLKADDLVEIPHSPSPPGTITHPRAQSVASADASPPNTRGRSREKKKKRQSKIPTPVKRKWDEWRFKTQ
jgi:hypothetical protein